MCSLAVVYRRFPLTLFPARSRLAANDCQQMFCIFLTCQRFKDQEIRTQDCLFYIYQFFFFDSTDNYLKRQVKCTASKSELLRVH